MNDRAVNLLEQYDIRVDKTRKGRGAIVCDTDRGCLIFKEYGGNEERLNLQDKLLRHIHDCSILKVEELLPTREGTLYVKDNDGVKYILKTYQEGRECNIFDRSECQEAVRILAQLHAASEFEVTGEWKGLLFYPERDYEKHNRELKKIKRYLKQRSQKTAFEIALLHTYDFFLEQALEVTAQWEEYSRLRDRLTDPDKMTLCHGDYQYHNILKCDDGWFLMNFERCIPDDPVRDLGLLMRKLLEKNGWSASLGKDLLDTYEKERPLCALSRIDLYYRLSYPEKFWKIANFYYNSGKAWIPDRNREKLEKLIDQEQDKQKFLEEVLRKCT